MVPSAVYIYYIFTIYSERWGRKMQYDFFLNKHKLGCDAVTYSRQSENKRRIILISLWLSSFTAACG